MGTLIGIAFLLVVGRFVYKQAKNRSTTAQSGRVASTGAGARLKHAGHAVGETPAVVWARARSQNWLEGKQAKRGHTGGRRYSNGQSRHLRPVDSARDWWQRTIWPDPETQPRTQDELAPRRERKNAPRQDEPPANSPDSPAGAHPSDQPSQSSPETDGGEQPPMSHSNGSGSGADLFSALQQVMSQARSGGLQAKHRAIKTFAEAEDYMSQTLQQFSQEMAEPDQGYPQSIWEPIQQASQHNRAAATKMAESDSAMTQLANMQVGELAASSVKAPHHSELNSDAASR